MLHGTKILLGTQCKISPEVRQKFRFARKGKIESGTPLIEESLQ